MRVLITGAEGQVGRELVEAFSTRGSHEVIATGRRELDVADRESTLQAICSSEPDVVVHAAAWTDVDGCELDAARALQVNALGTRHVGEGAALTRARVCYISSDYVFAGDASSPYTEWDATGPRSAYGRSKLGGEQELGPEATVVRTSWVCGRHGRNFVRSILAAAAERDELTVVDDQHGCPTFADDLASMIVRIVVSRLPGTFHVTNQGATTWYGLACATLASAGMDAGRVTPIATADLQPPRAAARPAWSVLDNAALRLSGIPLLPDFHEPLERLVKHVIT